jgi:hypothetical protein
VKAPQRGTAKSVVYSLALFAAVILIGLIVLTVSAYLARNDGINTSPRGDNPMVDYDHSPEDERLRRVVATEYSAARFAVAIKMAEREPGATDRSVLRALRDGAIPVPQNHVIETRLGWVKPVKGGYDLCVQSDATGAVWLEHGDMLRVNNCADFLTGTIIGQATSTGAPR